MEERTINRGFQWKLSWKHKIKSSLGFQPHCIIISKLNKKKTLNCPTPYDNIYCTPKLILQVYDYLALIAFSSNFNTIVVKYISHIWSFEIKSTVIRMSKGLKVHNVHMVELEGTWPRVFDIYWNSFCERVSFSEDCP